MKRLPFYSSGFLFLLAIINSTVNAQKLPNVQTVSLRAPANIKVDGKATEWGNKFQAYNHATDVYYTLSNNDENLYLTIQATDIQIIKRIVSSGITLTINPSGKKADKNGISITYPIYDKANKPNIQSAREIEVLQNTKLYDKQLDSLAYIDNKKVSDMAKQIRITGVKNIDSLISVYNEDGIKAAGGIDSKIAYTYELSVSLKNLGLSVIIPSMFVYNIKVNEVVQHGINIVNDDAGQISSINISKGAERGQPATDFWGEYTLAKKQ